MIGIGAASARRPLRFIPSSLTLHVFHMCASTRRFPCRLSFLSAQKRALGGKALEHDPTQPLVVHSVLGYIGGLEELIVWATANVADYQDPRDDPEYGAVEDELQTLADREFAAHIDAASLAGESAFAYLDFSSPALEAAASGRMNAGGAPSRPTTSGGAGGSAASSRPTTQGTGRRRAGSVETSGGGGDFGPHRVIVELFSRRCPQTTANFLALCTGSAGEATDPASGRTFPLHYTGSVVHRVVRDGWVQAGDIVSGRGCDGHSALGAPTFPDENLSIPLDAPGLLVMASNGPHTNASQFFLTQRELPAYTGKFVVFGRVIFGMATLALINTLPLRPNQRPVEPLHIVQSDVFTAGMLDDHVNKWTRKRNAPKKKKKAPVAAASRSVPESPRIAPKNVTLLIVGFDGSGKSTLVNNFLGRPFEHTNATVGFERNTISVPACPGPVSSSSAAAAAASSSSVGHASPFQVQLYGLGGASNIRGYWNNYLDAVHGLVFVVDASQTSPALWEELSAQFRALLTDPLVQGKPVLVYANKQDRPGALSSTEVSMRLHADDLAATSPHVHFVKCTARTDASRKPVPAESPLSPAGAALHPEALEMSGQHVGTSRDVDPNIPRGLSWLLGRIEAQYQSLSERVATDVAEARRKAKEQMDISRAKIKKAREEREAKEAEEEAAKAAAAQQ